MKDILLSLINGTKNLGREAMQQVMLKIVEGAYPSEQIAALLMGLQLKGITAEELLGFRDGLLQTGVAVDFTPYNTLDIVGTGGDGKNTFNISTCACFVVAGAGYKVTKHGNYAASSVSGAGNVLENHGVKFTADTDLLRKSLEESNFVYLHAPLFAKGMKNVVPVRKALGIPTCFNLLGPLLNPCKPKNQLLGVASFGQMRLYNSVLQKLDVNYCIVHSANGYDEATSTGSFKILSRLKGEASEKIIEPSNLKIEVADIKEIMGGATPMEAKEIFDAVLENRALKGQTNAVLMNAALAISLMEPAKTISECLDIARGALMSGKALAALRKYVQLNN